MGIERERKFLVNPRKLPWLELPWLPDFFTVETGYFTKDGVAIRVSHRFETDICKICIKSPAAEVRQEFEYTIPLQDA